MLHSAWKPVTIVLTGPYNGNQRTKKDATED